MMRAFCNNGASGDGSISQIHVEFEAFMHILLDWEEYNGIGGVLSLIAEISQKARRQDIRLEACKILEDWV